MTTQTMEMLPSATTEPARDNKKALIAGGLAAAVALGATGYFLLFSGSDSSEQGLVAPVHRTVAGAKPAKAVTAKRATAKPALVPVTSTARLGRDPFRALYVYQPSTSSAPAAASGGSTNPAFADTTSTPTTTVGTTTGAEYALKLVSVTGAAQDAKIYTFTVAGTTKRVIAAQRFGKYGELVVLAYTKTSSGRVTGAVIQVGDDNPVAIRIGEQLSVK
jgi:hypothetical protein